ncbi:hypothetical protein IV498_12975 [Paenarthrobacter sp. Z7-10]|nr:hypothetical protein [Paenarthrobacter sp. Z7-10]MCZ2404068.1 hypothetical protein [Paenarthrobacter sp. Z7-10]
MAFPNTACCSGAVSSVLILTEPTALSLTMATTRSADRTLVLAKSN